MVMYMYISWFTPAVRYLTVGQARRNIFHQYCDSITSTCYFSKPSMFCSVLQQQHHAIANMKQL